LSLIRLAVTEIEHFGSSDKAILTRFKEGAVLSRDPQQPHPLIIGIRVSGGWKFAAKKPAPRVVYSKSGAMRSKKTPNDLLRMRRVNYKAYYSQVANLGPSEMSRSNGSLN
jgi:hypothetical protein